jgi:hypothetical protein
MFDEKSWRSKISWDCPFKKRLDRGVEISSVRTSLLHMISSYNSLPHWDLRPQGTPTLRSSAMIVFQVSISLRMSFSCWHLVLFELPTLRLPNVWNFHSSQMNFSYWDFLLFKLGRWDLEKCELSMFEYPIIWDSYNEISRYFRLLLDSSRSMNPLLEIPNTCS